MPENYRNTDSASIREVAGQWIREAKSLGNLRVEQEVRQALKDLYGVDIVEKVEELSKFLDNLDSGRGKITRESASRRTLVIVVVRHWAHPQSPGAKVNEMGTYSSSTILNTSFLLPSASSLLTADAALRGPDLTIYIFGTTPPAPNATIVATYPPGLRPSDVTPYPVGVPIVGDNPIRLTTSKQSQIVGRFKSAYMDRRQG
ncbi:hypothetical protein AXG93_4509s1000 [Marchantia polymorpha subsp. ruderalis]|uniref:Uncharacterized protein n=1 Tax=Marchantia polymorpha subsp. ruderalis TaxID=1480154 RepID=A0A176WJB5_MARPO|nr:hypothetical protein AXG93_4509s1000 [Marchantia polymorpha subsp. ruderalis]